MAAGPDEVRKRDQRARGRFLGGIAPFGFRVENGELVKVPEQQRAIRRMLRLKSQGLSLRQIAAKLTETGTPISHMGVRKALATIEVNEREALR